MVAGVEQVDLLATERKRVFDSGVHTKDMLEGTEWKPGRGGGARQVGDLHVLVGMEFGEVDYHLTQLFTGHRNFRAWLFRIGMVKNPKCQYGD